MVWETGTTHQPFSERGAKFPSKTRAISQRGCVMLPFSISFATKHVSDRMVQLVSDHSRNCFYALSENNTISVFRTNGEKSVSHLQTLLNLYKMAQDKAPGSPAITPQTFAIHAIHVIEPGRSQTNDVHLVAVTANGLRLFFSPSSSGYNYAYGLSGGTSSGLQRPLALTHVRLPPPNLLHPDEQTQPFASSLSGYGSAHQVGSASRPYILKHLDNSCYEAGLLVASHPGDTDGTDFILCLSPDLTRVGSFGQVNGPQPQQGQYTNAYGTNAGPSRPPLTEYATLLAIPGRTWAMASVPRPAIAAAARSPADSPAYSTLNELAKQFSEPSRQFMILTNVGLTFLAKRRAVDYLKAVIEEYQSEGNAQPLIHFRDRCVRSETDRFSRNSTPTVVLVAIRPVPCCSRSRVGTLSLTLVTRLLEPSRQSARIWRRLRSKRSMTSANGRCGQRGQRMAQVRSM